MSQDWNKCDTEPSTLESPNVLIRLDDEDDIRRLLESFDIQARCCWDKRQSLDMRNNVAIIYNRMKTLFNEIMENESRKFKT